MKTRWRSGVATLAALGIVAGLWYAVPVPARADETPLPAPQGFAPLINRVKPAVVNIATTELEKSVNRQLLPQFPEFPPDSPFGQLFRQFQNQQPMPETTRKLTALGSGFIVDPSGYIVTNDHVVRNGTKIEVTLQDGTTLKAKVVGQDRMTDLAVLKVEADHPLPFVPFGDSDKTEVGDWVVSVGNPFGLGGTVTAGILSARGRNIHEGPYDDFLQIDAPINRGNSGGPTFNSQGEVVGINTAIFSPNGGGSVGIGFAIPSNLAKTVVAQLEQSGKIVRGWLGVAIQEIRPQMEDALGVKTTKGALVASVEADGPAAKAGLKPGDVITRFGDTPIERVRDLTWAVANTHPGTTASIGIVRDGRALSESVTVAELHPKGDQEASVTGSNHPKVGMELAPVTPQTRQQYGLARGVHGVLVVGIASDSPAELAGLKEGDVIMKIAGKPVHTPQQVAEAIGAARDAGKKSLGLDIQRDGQDMFVILGLGDAS